MKLFSILTLMTVGLMGLYGCGDELEATKKELKGLQKEEAEIATKIRELELKIAKLDTNALKEPEGVLVSTKMIRPGTFDHYIEVQGVAESNENIQMSTEIGGIVRQILVNEGDQVSEGQLLLKLADDVFQNNIGELQTSLDLAETIYKKRKNLWDKNIGSELQYLQAKNQMEGLQKKIQTILSQKKKTEIKAPFTGTIDEIFINEGEMAFPGMPVLRIVNLRNINMKADVSEAYIGSFSKGDSVTVEFPSIHKEASATISAVGQYIHPMNRTFKVEIKLANSDLILKPNLLGIIHLRSQVLLDALVVPTKYIQQDKGQNFVFITKREGKETQAQKKNIEIGLSYRGATVVTSGLNPNIELIADGSRTLADGDLIIIKN